MNLNLRKLEKRFDLKRYLEGYEHRMSGNNAMLTCPHCEKSDKLYVLVEDKLDTDGALVKRGSWVCYKCQDDGGSGRNCLSLIEWLEDVEFLEAVRRLAEGGTSGDADFLNAIEKAMADLDSDADQDAAPIPTIELPSDIVWIDAFHYPAYVRSRGISVKRAQRFKLGYCTSGYYRKRLIAPVIFEKRCVGFQARYMRKVPPEGTKKTKHSKGAKMSRVLYNWDVARHQRRIVLLEDPWSAIHVGKQGVASFGTHLSASQLELLMKSEAREIVIMWDLDPGAKPGKGGYDKAVSLAERLAQIVPTRVVKLPDERDPDEHSLKSLRRIIKETPLLSSTDAWTAAVTRRIERS